MITTESIVGRPSTRVLQERADSGEPMTTIRSPGMITSSPRGMTTPSGRMMLATLQSWGRRASLSGTPTTASVGCSIGMSNSTICTRPSANMSVCRAAGTPVICVTAFAVSNGGDTIRSNSRSPARHTSRYSVLLTRTTVRPPDSRLANSAATMFTSSRCVQVMVRSASATCASISVRRLAASPTTASTSVSAPSDRSASGSASITVPEWWVGGGPTIREPTWPAPITTTFKPRTGPIYQPSAEPDLTGRPYTPHMEMQALSEATQEYLESIYWLYESGIDRTQAN